MQGTGRIAPQINTEHISVGHGRHSFPANFAPNLASRSVDTIDNRQSDYDPVDDHSLSTLSQTINQSCNYVNRPRVSSFPTLYRTVVSDQMLFYRAWWRIESRNTPRRTTRITPPTHKSKHHISMLRGLVCDQNHLPICASPPHHRILSKTGTT